jgi:thiol:disulfide interchange protein
MVKSIKSMSEWGTLMETSKEKLVVVDFTATWCVPYTIHTVPFVLLSTKIK